MDLDRDLAEPELTRHLLVHEACRDEGHDFALPHGQRLESSADSSNRLIRITPFAIRLKGVRDGIQHVLIAEWLRQKIDRTSLHCAHRHRDVAMASHEDDWDGNL